MGDIYFENVMPSFYWIKIYIPDLSEPMGEKTVNELAGIGEVMGKRLAAKGKIHIPFAILWILILKSLPNLFKNE